MRDAAIVTKHDMQTRLTAEMCENQLACLNTAQRPPRVQQSRFYLLELTNIRPFMHMENMEHVVRSISSWKCRILVEVRYSCQVGVRLDPTSY